MVAVKGRLNSIRDRMADDPKMSKRGEGKDIKIYVEVDKVKNPDTLNNRIKRQSTALKSKVHMLNFNDSKSGVKNLEKGKTKSDKSMSSKVGRKVLADIGNRNRSYSETEQGKSSIPGKGKGETKLLQERNAVDLGEKEGTSRKISTESIAVDVIQDIGDNQTSKQFVKENAKTASDEPRMKVQSRNSMTTTVAKRNFVRENVKSASYEPRMKLQNRNSITTTVTGRKPVKENVKTASEKTRMNVQNRSSITSTFTGRKSARNPPLTRKSLPVAVLQQASRAETSGTSKENSEKSSFRRKHGFAVNPSARGSILPKPTNRHSRPWGNRVSDGFVMMTSRTETKMDAGVRSRNSIKSKFMSFKFQPTVQKTNTVQRKLKSSQIATTKKVMSRPADVSKTKEDKLAMSKNKPSVVSQDEHAPENTSSGTIQRRKSDRRNSFISTIMSNSKLVKQRTKVASEEPLPDIYDNRNHLEVCDYVDDIYQYYWFMEGQNPSLKDYLVSQKDITPQMRGILINWLIEVHHKFELMDETLFLTVTLLDRYLSLENIKKNEMQLVGLTALLLASKYEDFWHPRVSDLISISAESYTKNQMLQMEKTILKKLKFRMNEPTLYVFMLRFLRAAQSNIKFERLAFYLIELCLVEYEALNYKPSMLCASAIYVARCTMQLTPPWTPLLTKHARYEESQIRGCAEMILKFHKAAKTSLLKVTYEKYANADFSKVATIKPMDRLPS